MKIVSAPTIVISIYCAGDYDDARRVCRDVCQAGLCVTVERCAFIYTNGEEAGVRVGLVNYPRFPTDAEALSKTAGALAEQLIVALHQWTALIVGPLETQWLTRRADDGDAKLSSTIGLSGSSANASERRDEPQSLYQGPDGGEMSETLVIPIPIRADVTAWLRIPADLTPDEAEKIARIVKAYVRPVTIPSNLPEGR